MIFVTSDYARLANESHRFPLIAETKIHKRFSLTVDILDISVGTTCFGCSEEKQSVGLFGRRCVVCYGGVVFRGEVELAFVGGGKSAPKQCYYSLVWRRNASFYFRRLVCHTEIYLH